MNFNDIKTGSILGYSNKLKEGWQELEHPEPWEHEPLDCYFEVTTIKKESMFSLDLESYIEIECVNSCDCHIDCRITKEEYELLSSELGEHMLQEASSMANFSDVFGYKEVEEDLNFNFSDNLDSIRKLICKKD